MIGGLKNVGRVEQYCLWLRPLAFIAMVVFTYSRFSERIKGQLFIFFTEADL